jgi:hypothetical protein
MFNQEKIKDLEKRILDLEKLKPMFADLQNFQLDLEKLKTNMNSLRGTVNKKLGGLDQDQEVDQTKSINTGIKYY